ncbi:tRNA lysidine(34) synthetase TilS [Legionella jamestowniensis]|uniref:tRNA lysidine(34) synthetase TilS n=1 Tax=Legionella jamestowniensis TaxID=455 RepID=UPI000A50998C|nr:tRNA lysidine(34) synthetase TilS [Legionella jamestowniensis]
MTKGLLDTEFLEYLRRYNRIFVGYSGGLDSTALLHSLSTNPQLLSKLTAVHINHGLSPNALHWQQHCQLFCKKLKISLLIKRVDFKRDANIEDAARRARYGVFSHLLENEDCLVLGHHLNDQAETMLLHLLRGTGIDGLAGMPSRKVFARGEMLRPLLSHSRKTLEEYANFHGLAWINDESNENIAFSRNFLRHQVMPLLASRWPQVVNSLVRTSKHCRQAQKNLEDLAKIDCPELKGKSNQLPLDGLSTLNEARLTNVLRVWLKANQVKLPPAVTFERLIFEVIKAKPDANPQVTWEDNCVRRYQDVLYLVKEVEVPYSSLIWNSFPKPLNLGADLGILNVCVSKKGLVVPAKSIIEVRFRQGGETFVWHGQTKELKKLFQEWQVPPWLRARIPLLYINQQLACVVGYAVSDQFYDANVKVAYQLSVS